MKRSKRIMKCAPFVIACGVLFARGTATWAYEWNDYAWHEYNGHYYALTIGGPFSWADAELEAESVTSGGQLVGATLVNINDEQEQNWLSAVFPYSQGPLWIGLWQDPDDPDYREPGEPQPPDYGGWKWICQDPVTYTNWAPGEPNEALPEETNEDRAAMHAFGPGLWQDVPCDATYAYYRGIIEVPEPGTLMLLGAAGLCIVLKRRSR